MRFRVLVITMLLCAGVAGAQSRVMHLGARAAGMGGAYTGVADDHTAFYWNPAGIAFGSFLSAGVYHGHDDSERDGRSFEDRATGFSLRYTFMGVALTDFRRTAASANASASPAEAHGRRRVDDRGLDTFDVAVSLLQSLPVDNLVVAGNLHYLSGTTTVGDAEAESSSWDVDLGVMYEPTLSMRIGVMLSHLREARFVVPDDDERLRLERHARAGVSFELPQSLRVAFDVDLSTQGPADDGWREVALGAEKGLFDRRVHVRGGVRAEVGSDLGTRPAIAVGAGVHVWLFELQAAYLGSSGRRDEAYWFGVSLAR
jgi:hypothetical protein